MSINHVTLVGNLTHNPEVRRTQSGMAIMTLRIAVNERKKNNQTGEWEEYSNYFSCIMFGSRAESVSNYLSKGSKVAVDGKLRYSSWEADGQKRSKVEVVVEDIDFMSKGQGGQQGGQRNQTPQAQYSDASYYDAEIPFD